MSAEESNKIAADKAAIREAIEQWAIFRDMGDAERIAPLYAEGARMHTLFMDAPAADFIRLVGAPHGPAKGTHFMGAGLIEVEGARALAATQFLLCVRARLGPVLCDITANARFHDLFIKIDGRWRIWERHAVYEKDRIDSVEPGAAIPLDRAILDSLPEPCRHLAYLQAMAGKAIRANDPPYHGEALAELGRRARAWVSGGAP